MFWKRGGKEEMDTQSMDNEYEIVYNLIIRSCVAGSGFSKELKKEIFKYLEKTNMDERILDELSKDIADTGWKGYVSAKDVIEDYRDWVKNNG